MLQRCFRNVRKRKLIVAMSEEENAEIQQRLLSLVTENRNDSRVNET